MLFLCFVWLANADTLVRSIGQLNCTIHYEQRGYITQQIVSSDGRKDADDPCSSRIGKAGGRQPLIELFSDCLIGKGLGYVVVHTRCKATLPVSLYGVGR